MADRSVGGCKIVVNAASGTLWGHMSSTAARGKHGCENRGSKYTETWYPFSVVLNTETLQIVLDKVELLRFPIVSFSILFGKVKMQVLWYLGISGITHDVINPFTAKFINSVNFPVTQLVLGITEINVRAL